MSRFRYTILPMDDPGQMLRIRRFSIAVVSYIMWITLLIYCYDKGLVWMSSEVLTGIIIANIIINLIFFGLFRTGLNKRFEDPSLTMAQMCVGSLFAVTITYYADDIRGVMLLIFLVVFTFGVFRLRVRQFLVLTVLILVSYGGIILFIIHVQPSRINIALEFLTWIVLAAFLTWFSFVGGYINRLRVSVVKFNNELTQAMATIAELAIHDELTQVFNRRHIFTILQREKSLADRGKSSFSICMFDLDNFKNINDTYGHMAGDVVLKTIAQTIQVNIREADYLARYGGEEFLLIMTYPDVEEGVKCAERIRQICAEVQYATLPESVRVTISGGVTAYQPAESVDALVQRADFALYGAKGNGRNCIEYLPQTSQKQNEDMPGALQGGDETI